MQMANGVAMSRLAVISLLLSRLLATLLRTAAWSNGSEVLLLLLLLLLTIESNYSANKASHRFPLLHAFHRVATITTAQPTTNDVIRENLG